MEYKDNLSRPDSGFGTKDQTINGPENGFGIANKKIGRNDKNKDYERNKTYAKWIKDELKKRGISPKTPLSNVPKGPKPVRTNVKNPS